VGFGDAEERWCVTLDEVNACDRAQFVAALGWIFERSPWVAERAWEHRPFAGPEHLQAAMMAAVANATMDEKLALLRAHPDLGTRANMSDASAGEQEAAGLDRLTREELDRLRALNAAYRQKFGYPFIFAVRNSTKHHILDALERRLQSEPDEELAEALRQVARIAELRLEGLIR
jgi:2-oxo-4-hydroxy-4-carboxy-5-ureidoimidazoline decarboxylase